MRIDEARSWLLTQFAQSESPAADADCLLCHVLGVSRTWLRTWPERALTDPQWLQLQSLAARRQRGEPVAHLLGVREFWSLPLRVNSSTLIPRPDTEVLVEEALGCLQGRVTPRAVDLGTGTGAIALALKSERPDLQMWAVERSPEAFSLAQDNATRLALTLELRLGSWFEPLADEQFDLIVSNPPYIDAADPHLEQGDVRFEPRSALVAEEQGLADLRHVIEYAPHHLLANGWLLLEHGWQQAAAVQALLSQRGFDHITTRRDYGDQERVTLGRWPGGAYELPSGT